MSVFLTLTPAEYSAAAGIRASHLKEVLRSPAHYQAAIKAERKETAAMKRGTDMHAAILEGDKFELHYAVAPSFDRRTKAGKEAAAEFEAANAGKTLISADEYEAIANVVHNVYAHPVASGLLAQGNAESSVFWKDAESGLDCKCRPDFIPASGNLIVDIKTTQDASFRGFQRSIANFKYHLQAAYYMDGVRFASGLDLTAFVIVAVESVAPYAVSVFELDFGSIEKGRELYRTALNTIGECSSRNEWPAYAEQIQSINLPAWAFAEGDE